MGHCTDQGDGVQVRYVHTVWNVEIVNQKCKHGRRRRSKCKDVASASSSFI